MQGLTTKLKEKLFVLGSLTVTCHIYAFVFLGFSSVDNATRLCSVVCTKETKILIPTFVPSCVDLKPEAVKLKTKCSPVSYKIYLYHEGGGK